MWTADVEREPESLCHAAQDIGTSSRLKAAATRSPRLGQTRVAGHEAGALAILAQGFTPFHRRRGLGQGSVGWAPEAANDVEGPNDAPVGKCHAPTVGRERKVRNVCRPARISRGDSTLLEHPSCVHVDTK
jgi:hypothetical protein